MEILYIQYETKQYNKHHSNKKERKIADEEETLYFSKLS